MGGPHLAGQVHVNGADESYDDQDDRGHAHHGGEQPVDDGPGDQSERRGGLVPQTGDDVFDGVGRLDRPVGGRPFVRWNSVIR